MECTMRFVRLVPLLLSMLGACYPCLARRYANDTVHVVFSNHLDVGFTDLDNEVINLYFHTHYPRAIRLAKDMEERDSFGDRFAYLTHSFLISLYFDCPSGMGFVCPNATEVEAMSDAIERGYITWHAIPFNPNYEAFDGPLLEFAIQHTHGLDKRFNKPLKATASLRDVPGATRGIIPAFNNQGVRAISGGVNGFSAPPGVPKNTPFIWRDPETNQQILAMWHPGGYGGRQKDGFPIASKHDCIRHKGLSHLLCVSWRDDNGGPPNNVSEVQKMFKILRHQFPGAEVKASTLDEYVEALEAAAPGLDLPVVTGEIGDTWIHGMGTDPVRVANYRAALRARAHCLQETSCDSTSYAFSNFSRLLMKVAEHTQGLAFNQYFGDTSNYSNPYLHQQLRHAADHPGLLKVTLSWQRQRDYVDWALQALPEDHPIVVYVKEDMAARQVHARVGLSSNPSTTSSDSSSAPELGPFPRGPAAVAASRKLAAAATATSSLQHASSATALGRRLPLSAAALRFKTDTWQFALDPKTGGFTSLRRLHGEDKCPGNDWAGGQQPTAAASPGCSIKSSRNKEASRSYSPGAGSSAAPMGLLQRCGRLIVRLWMHLFMRRLSMTSMPSPAAAAEGCEQGSCGSRASALAAAAVADTLDSSCSCSSDMGAKTGCSCHRHRRGPHFGEMQYNVYNEEDYSIVWEHYAYMHPVWTGDFGKYNLSASSSLRVTAQPTLREVFVNEDRDLGLLLHLHLSFPHHLVRDAGAPAAVWMVLHAPPGAPRLNLTVVWQDKTPTRLPEAVWVRFKPGRGAVDVGSWKMKKINSSISPDEILVNGSHSMHALSPHDGVSVSSPGGQEQLSIWGVDAALLALGRPQPMPNACLGPDMSDGVSWNLVNNVWGTNYPMWVPWSEEEVNMAFRFVLEVQLMQQGGGKGQLQ